MWTIEYGWFRGKHFTHRYRAYTRSPGSRPYIVDTDQLRHLRRAMFTSVTQGITDTALGNRKLFSGRYEIIVWRSSLCEIVTPVDSTSRAGYHISDALQMLDR